VGVFGRSWAAAKEELAEFMLVRPHPFNEAHANSYMQSEGWAYKQAHARRTAHARAVMGDWLCISLPNNAHWRAATCFMACLCACVPARAREGARAGAGVGAGWGRGGRRGGSWAQAKQELYEFETSHL
jgi:hypothetical protein